MQEEKDISVIIPVFNAESCISRLIKEVHTVLGESGKSFEILVVDDCSKDQSWQLIKEACRETEHVKAFSLAKNFGQHKATLCGFYHCKGAVVITLDDDFEHQPKDILALYQTIITTDKDVVYAMPTNVKKTFTRKAITTFYKFISKVENPYAGLGSSFRALKKDLVTNIVSHQNHLFFVDELILWYTASIGVYQAEFGHSQKKVSGYSYSKLFSLSSNVLMISTTMPLKLVKALGMSMSAISFVIGLFYFMKKILLKTPAGYTSIIVSVLFSTGLILFCIGIIGEYLGNVLMMQNNKPAFYVREKI